MFLRGRRSPFTATGSSRRSSAGWPSARPEAAQDAGGLLSLLVWLAFGAIAVGPAFALGRGAAAFIGWFGPRGLASVVFGLLTLETLGEAVSVAGGLPLPSQSY
jgi:sodium/hydrogen antiporter